MTDLDSLLRQASIHINNEEYKAAVSVLSTSLILYPDSDLALYDSGNFCHLIGRTDITHTLLRRSLKINPYFLMANVNLVKFVYMTRISNDDEFIICRRIVVIDPSYYESYLILGHSLANKDDWETADISWNRLLIIDKQNIHGLYGFIAKFLKNGSNDKAVKFAMSAISLDPSNTIGYVGLGRGLGNLRRWNESTIVLNKALKIDDHCYDALNQMGADLIAVDRWEDAARVSYAASVIRPDDSCPYYNRALALRTETDARVRFYRRAILIDHNIAIFHGDLSLELLRRGDFEEGWQEYEWRWLVPQVSFTSRHFQVPQWHGEQGEGRWLLIHSEQGQGDTIQFCRYIPLIAAKGWHVIVEVEQSLACLMKCLPSIDIVIAKGEKLPKFHSHCPMMSLPLAFGTRLETIPAMPSYLQADHGKSQSWKLRLDSAYGNKPRIGLAWAGDSGKHRPPDASDIDRLRSIPPELLLPLTDCKDIVFFSLQKDDNLSGSKMLHLVNFMHEMADFADTAAFVVNLDLVVSVDTSVMHLAAALGKPVWMLDRFYGCWRWLYNREDSPWYPTLRIFRQSAPRDWEDVVERVKMALVGISNSHYAICLP